MINELLTYVNSIGVDRMFSEMKGRMSFSLLNGSTLANVECDVLLLLHDQRVYEVEHVQSDEIVDYLQTVNLLKKQKVGEIDRRHHVFDDEANLVYTFPVNLVTWLKEFGQYTFIFSPLKEVDPGGITQQLIAHLKQREQMSIETYGQTLKAFNGRDAVQDALEEALDLSQYLLQAKVERKAFVDMLGRVAKIETVLGAPFNWEDLRSIVDSCRDLLDKIG